LFEGAIHSADVPRLAGAGGPIDFSLTWTISDDDYDDFPLFDAFGRSGVKRLDMHFRHADGAVELWKYQADGVEIAAYEGKSPDGFPIRRKALRARNLLPRPHYMHIDRSIMTTFQARLYQAPAPDAAETNARPVAGTHESSLLRLAGLAAETRQVKDGAWEEPLIFSRPALSFEEVERRLADVSTRLTNAVRRWWHDPPGVTVSVRLAGTDETKRSSFKENNLHVVCDLVDAVGLPMLGTGFLWFFTFLVNLELLTEWRRPMFLLIDEPATPLHPSAQRQTAKLLDEVARRHQVIYSTHSPFLIDWNFPQRIRVFERDADTRRSVINNRPYASANEIWDPLRESIGVTVGDIGVLADLTLLVEGVTDQIILANASRVLETQGGPSVDLARTSIIPYGTERALEHVIAMGNRGGVRIVCVADADEQGRKAAAVCRKTGTRCVSTGEVIPDARTETSIEDLIGLSDYVAAVNRAYEPFSWFSTLTEGDVQSARGSRSLGAALEFLFAEKFNKDFSKMLVATVVADSLWEGSVQVPPAVRSLIEAVSA
jgi:AAA ATPase domain